VKRLIGFSRVELKPGERQRVSVEADPRLLGRYDEAAHGWRVAGGLYRIEVGGASDETALSGGARVRARRLAP
jgi:beta-glucosidase